jgi:hypothetical protein
MLKKHVGFFSSGDTAAKATILAHYVNYSKLFEGHLHCLFDHDRVIQRKLKSDFDYNLMAFVRWIQSPDNQIPLHANMKGDKTGPIDLKKFVGFTTTGVTAAKTIILGYYYPYGQLLQDVIHQQFEQDPMIQNMLRKTGDLYALLRSLEPSEKD